MPTQQENTCLSQGCPWQHNIPGKIPLFNRTEFTTGCYGRLVSSIYRPHWEKDYNETEDEVPDIQYVQIKKYIEYGVIGTIAIFVLLLTCCWFSQTGLGQVLCSRIAGCCKPKQ